MRLCVHNLDKNHAKKARVLWVILVLRSPEHNHVCFILIAQLNKLSVAFHVSVLSSFSIPIGERDAGWPTCSVLSAMLIEADSATFKQQDLWGNWFLISDPCFLSFFFSPLSVALVPKGNKTVPAPLGTFVSHQHLSGGWHPHVVPVERAERLHWGNLELRVLPGHVFCAAQPHRTARWVFGKLSTYLDLAVFRNVCLVLVVFSKWGWWIWRIYRPNDMKSLWFKKNLYRLYCDTHFILRHRHAIRQVTKM